MTDCKRQWTFKYPTKLPPQQHEDWLNKRSDKVVEGEKIHAQLEDLIMYERLAGRTHRQGQETTHVAVKQRPADAGGSSTAARADHLHGDKMPLDLRPDLKSQQLSPWFVQEVSVQAKSTVVINKIDKYTFNGKRLKPGSYQVTSYVDHAETERELEAQNAFESHKKHTTAPGWYYLGLGPKEDLTKMTVCKKHDQAHTVVDGCPWCE